MNRSFFEGDLVDRKIFGVLLVIQFAALSAVLLLIFIGQPAVSLVLSFVTLLILGAFAAYVLNRFRRLPVVQEKRLLEQQAIDAQAHIQIEQQAVEQARQLRQNLAQDEQRELKESLLSLQQAFVQQGLQTSLLQDATILGIGPKLKERLADSSIRDASSVHAGMPQVPGVGDAKRLALLAWRAAVLTRLNVNKPRSLPPGQEASIRQKYQALNGDNVAREKRAQESKQQYERSLQENQKALSQFAGITLGRFLGQCVDSRGYVSVILFVAMLGVQVVSGATSATSAVRAAIPTSAPTFTPTATPSLTPLPTGTRTASATPPATITLTLAPTATLLPTATSLLPASMAGAACIPTVPPQTGRVVSVVDGDTIKVLLDQDGKTYSVRYIGMDTPEMNQGGLLAAQATLANSDLVYGRKVMLIKDVSETDRYGRLLRYVIADGIFVNLELVARGYATAATYPPDVACQSTYLAAEQQARAASLGLWAAAAEQAPLPLPTSQVDAACSCSGNLYNCSDFSSHAQAQACYNYCISIGRGDVHRLDGNSDGDACESLP